MASEKSILIIDDDPHVRRLLSEFFGKKHYRLREAGGGEEGLQMASAERPSVVLLDMRMPGMDGMETLRRLLALHPGLGVVIMTGSHRDESSVQEALELGAYGYVLKPFDFLYLELVVTSKLMIAES
jgi:DNA-binding NtrC family response regulator